MIVPSRLFSRRDLPPAVKWWCACLWNEAVCEQQSFQVIASAFDQRYGLPASQVGHILLVLATYRLISFQRQSEHTYDVTLLTPEQNA